jgi:hypothetical protein
MPAAEKKHRAQPLHHSKGFPGFCKRTLSGFPGFCKGQQAVLNHLLHGAVVEQRGKDRVEREFNFFLC